ncbi:MAG: hypothetical protein QXG65_03400 [Thermoplasmata archaeon]
MRSPPPANGPVDASNVGIAVSLFALCALLAALLVRGMISFLRSKRRSQLMWAGGLGCAAAAMGIEAVVYVGVVSSGLLQLYVFLSAAIVGILSLGVTRLLRRPRWEAAYTAYTLSACAATGIACALTPLDPSMVVGGVIAGNPPLLLLAFSSLVTVPATVLLLAATVISLRRTRRWPTLCLAAGALILGAGGAFYIASFPIALYYAEFAGIVLLFVGIVQIPVAHAAGAAAPAAARPTG